jgi:hypothetical protein
VNSWFDIFEHKFLVYECNAGNLHWLSIVVINPLLVFNQYLLAEGKDAVALGDEDFVGWCILDSLPSKVERMDVQGFQGTIGTINKEK